MHESDEPAIRAWQRAGDVLSYVANTGHGLSDDPDTDRGLPLTLAGSVFTFVNEANRPSRRGAVYPQT